MAYRALTHVLRGNAPPVEPGEIVPDTFLDVFANEQPVDFERLVELGAAEKVEASQPAAKRPASKPAAKD